MAISDSRFIVPHKPVGEATFCVEKRSLSQTFCGFAVEITWSPEIALLAAFFGRDGWSGLCNELQGLPSCSFGGRYLRSHGLFAQHPVNLDKIKVDDDENLYKFGVRDRSTVEKNLLVKQLQQPAG